MKFGLKQKQNESDLEFLIRMSRKTNVIVSQNAQRHSMRPGSSTLNRRGKSSCLNILNCRLSMNAWPVDAYQSLRSQHPNSKLVIFIYYFPKISENKLITGKLHETCQSFNEPNRSNKTFQEKSLDS